MVVQTWGRVQWLKMDIGMVFVLMGVAVVVGLIVVVVVVAPVMMIVSQRKSWGLIC